MFSLAASIAALGVVAMVLPLKRQLLLQNQWLNAQQAGQLSTVIILQHLGHGRLLPSGDHKLRLKEHGLITEIYVTKSRASPLYSLYLKSGGRIAEAVVCSVSSLTLKFDGLDAAKVPNWGRVRGVQFDLMLKANLPWSFYVAI